MAEVIASGNRRVGIPASAAALLAGVVEFAGLFPPAALDLRAAAGEYAASLAGDDGWMLGRFVLPGARLPELAQLRADAIRDASAVSDWVVSALVGTGEDEIDRALVGSGDHLRVDALECKPSNLDSLERLSNRVANGLYVYVEVPPAEATTWLPHLASLGLRAKIRTGGVTADAFPPPALVIGFIAAALEHKVAFKATAGLHHAVRGAYRLTYAADSACAPMYGYLNVLLTTAALHSGLPLSRAEALLRRGDTSDLAFTDESVQWRDVEFPLSALHAVRSTGLVSFGSCSFREPVGELHALLASQT